MHLTIDRFLKWTLLRVPHRFCGFFHCSCAAEMFNFLAFLVGSIFSIALSNEVKKLAIMGPPALLPRGGNFGFSALRELFRAR